MQHVSTLGTTPHPLLSDRPPQRPSSQARKTLLWEYGIALLAVMTAVALRMALTPWLGTRVPFITLFPAAAVAVWYGGYRPALVAALLGYAAVDYFIRDPATPMGVPTNAASFVAYSLSCGIMPSAKACVARAAGYSSARAACSGRWKRLPSCMSFRCALPPLMI